MATLPIERPVTPLRQRMLDDMAMRAMRSRTQHDYVRHVRAFAAFLGRSPHTATAEDVRLFQLHQREHGVGESVINGTVSALRFLFGVTLERPDLSRRLVLAHRPRKLPDVLSVDEVGQLLEAAPGIKYRAALGVAYGAGLRVSEVAHLRADDIDSKRMLIRIEEGRRWCFGSAVLDEDSWTLSVDGRRIVLEGKPLDLLHELLLRAGQLVTKDELLDAVWPGLSVVEASLPTAVNKLRRALGYEQAGSRVIETVPRLGYRLTVPVEVGLAQPDAARAPAQVPAASLIASPPRRWPAIAAGLALVLTAGAFALATMTRTAAAPAPAPAFTQRDVDEAIRHLDVERIERLLRAGWNPNTPINQYDDGAMTMVLNICEWNPGHDKSRLLLMARTLMEAGVRIDQHNKWGDSPYSIAKAKRYCGPDHPVTKMMYASCYTGYKPPGDKCLATYEKRGGK